MIGRFYLSYAVRSLWRGGQRTLLAIICVAFGVMSLVAMMLLASLISDTILLDPRLSLGGDLAAVRFGQYISPEDTALLDGMVADGRLSAYTPLAEHTRRRL